MVRLIGISTLTALLMASLGCGGPMLVFPGGRLSGEVSKEKVDDWSFLTASFVELETRPDEPYSVQLNYFVRDGKLFIDPAEGRRWYGYLKDDPRVRARFDGTIYPLIAVLVGQPGEVGGFDAARYVYRLDPRP